MGMKELKQAQVKAGQALVPAQAAYEYVMQNHAGYAAALKTNKTAAAAYQDVYDQAQAIINALMADPSTDQSWFNAKDPNTPVWLRDNAYARMDELGQAKQAIIADLAAHFTIEVHEAAADPEKAAIDADVAAKVPSPHLPYWNPNLATPHDQSNEHPPVDVPPEPEEEGRPWLVIGLVVAGVALLVKLVVR